MLKSLRCAIGVLPRLTSSSLPVGCERGALNMIYLCISMPFFAALYLPIVYSSTVFYSSLYWFTWLIWNPGFVGDSYVLICICQLYVSLGIQITVFEYILPRKVQQTAGLSGLLGFCTLVSPSSIPTSALSMEISHVSSLE